MHSRIPEASASGILLSRQLLNCNAIDIRLIGAQLF